MSMLTPRPDQEDATLHGDVGRRSSEGVGGHLPALGGEPVGQVEQGVAGVGAVADPPGDGGDAGGWVAVAQELEWAQL